MNDLSEKIKQLIEKETRAGRYTILNTTTNVDLIKQIIRYYEQNNEIKQLGPEDELPKNEKDVTELKDDLDIEKVMVNNRVHGKENYIEINVPKLSAMILKLV